MNILGKQRDLPFSRKSDRKKEKSTVSFSHEQNIICSQTQLDGFAHEQTIICRQLFAGHVLGSRSMKKKEKFASNYSITCTVLLTWCIILWLTHYFQGFVMGAPQNFSRTLNLTLW